MGAADRKCEQAIILVMAIVLMGLLVWWVCTNFFYKSGATITIGETVFAAKVAKSEEERAAGLSGTAYLPPNHAMLFVFPHADFWGIWMRDMRYPIDVVWLDETYKVVHIEHSMQPGSYPKVYRPTKKAKYVVEFAASTAKMTYLTIGQEVRIVQ